MKLNFKASNIRKAEKELNQKFFTSFDGLTGGNIGMEDLWFLFYAGGGTEEQFDEEMRKGIKNVLLTIFEGINDAVFKPETRHQSNREDDGRSDESSTTKSDGWFYKFWDSQINVAFEIGLTPTEYYELSFGQFFDCLKGYRQRKESEYKHLDMLNHLLGQYVAFAFHDRSHYPKHPYLEKSGNSQKRRMTDEEMAATARRNAAQWKELENGRRNHH